MDAPQAPAFLDVENSLTAGRWRLRSENERLGLAIAQRLDVPEIVGRVMAGRGVPLEEAEQYLTPQLRHLLPDPSSFKDMDTGAMRIAATAIREYGKPVGLLVWQGRHAWVMSGFEATGDPVDGSFRVTRAYILDPLYPHGSREWGRSPKPGTAIPVSQVGEQFVRRRSLVSGSPWNRLPGMARLAGKYVLVVPAGAIRPGID